MNEVSEPIRQLTRQEEAENQCGARGIDAGVRVVCELEANHVKTMDDWHEAFGKTSTEVRTNIFEMTTTHVEHFRWAPNEFELQDKEAARRLLNRKLPKDENDD